MRSARWSVRARFAALASVLAGGLACTSPTLPLPPPAQPTVSIGSAPNTFHLRSEKGVIPNALVVVVNRNASVPLDQRVEGTLADEQGSWELDIVANVDDVVDITQEDGTTRSPAISVILK